MPFIIAIIIVLLVIIVSLLINRHINEVNERYNNFVLRKSTALKKLKEVNSEFSFCRDIANFDAKHIYDNEKFYKTVSCEDYLIYSLQFIMAKVEQAIRLTKSNEELYHKYIDKVKNIGALGIFDGSLEGFKRKKLENIEKEIFKKTILKPQTVFNIRISLGCSTIDGRVYDMKRACFSSKEIVMLIRKLNNKYNGFYYDRDIWDAICRVERAKVTNKMRFAIYKRDGYRCRMCGRSDDYTFLEIDHIKPIAKGGKTTFDNLQTLCSRCNKWKGDKY